MLGSEKFTLTLFLVFLLFLSAQPLYGEEPSISSVNVKVRTLEAFESIHSGSSDSSRMPLRYEIDERLDDLRPKLKQLHFRKYKLRSSTNHALAFERQEMLDLGDGHTLALKPLYRNKDKLCLWVEWKDSSGMQIINTRLHMNTKESMITGTDHGDDGGMILAISVDQ